MAQIGNFGPGKLSATLGIIIKNSSRFLRKESFIYGLHWHFYVTESSEHLGMGRAYSFIVSKARPG